MGTNNLETNRVKAVELKMRGRAMEDSIRGAAEASASQAEPGEALAARTAARHFPFETALRAQIRAMEARFGALVQDAPYAMIVADSEGRIAFTNALAGRLFGYEGEELLGSKLSSVVAGPMIEQLEARGAERALDEIGEMTTRGVELVGRRKDGAQFQAEVLFSLIAGAGTPLVCLSVRDLGTSKAEHRKLIEAERRLRLVFDALPDAVVAVNSRGRVTQLNVAAEAMFGYGRDDVVGKAASRILPEALVERLAAALSARPSERNETVPLVAKNKSGKDVAIDVRIARIDDERTKSSVAIIRFVSDIAKEDREHHVAGFHGLIADAAPEAILAVQPDGRVVFANARAEALFGCGTGEMIGERAARFLPEDVAEHLRDASLASGKDVVAGVELFGRRKGDGRFPVEVLFSPLDADGQALFVISVRDLSLKRAAELQARRVRADRARRPSAGGNDDSVPLAGATLDSIGDALVSADPNGNVYFLNQAAESLTGWSWEEAAGRPAHEIIHVIDAGTRVLFRDDPAGVAGDRIVQFNPNVTLIRRDGGEVPIEGSMAPIEGRDGRPAGKVMIFRDVSLVRAQAREIAYSAQHDPLTGLPNRLLLNDRINNAISIAPRHQKRVAVLFLDLDGFKQINDTLGHATGDKLLRAVADRLMECVRGSDTVSRIGGDEFVVLLSEVERAEDSAISARRMLEAISEPYFIDQHELKITVSIGVGAYPDDGADAETLIKNADAAMYQAKENGRSGYQFYKPAMNLRAVERQDVEEALRRALEREEFALHFQPKVNLHNGDIAGAEALLRWEHPTKGSISPALFMPIAEASGLIVPIGRWVMREACRQVHAWQKAGLIVPTVAVNVSSAEFSAPRFLDGVFDVLNEIGLEPHALELELNEGALMKRIDATQSILGALAASGVLMSVDDFGMGYSSLDNLRRFPIHMLKIDQSFVREITLEKKEANIVTAVLNMAQSMNLRVVAEGVETSEELAFLQRHHCDEAQGYYFSRPLPSGEFTRLLRDGLVSTMAARRYARPFGRLHNHALGTS